ncbi:type IV secretory system conjugative DNA transfer family protein [Actinospica robiniae]|uniref:type IV secretory system conjugative DNA transfer family protein n=1 Tax=Actinospica robiniae TaxID=304901 RepID=UPI0003FB2F1C|nr:type IV secretion system DNA-binding domain-containing protein [Actinospica robiniae]
MMNLHTDPFAVLAPAGWLTSALREARALAIRDWPQVSITAAFSAYSATATVSRTRRHRRNQLLTGARVLEIACPPESSPSGAVTLWSNLLGLHRPRSARLIHGQPHVAFEYVFTGRELSIRMWVPGRVPPRMVERAIEAAWPGARAKALDLPLSPLPPAGPGDAVTGGRLVLARTEALPLNVKHDADPLRALIGAGTALGAGQGACVQVLARPASSRRVARARHRLRRLEGKQYATATSMLFDTLTPGRADGARPSAFMDARLVADARAAAGKLAGPLYEAEIRYAALAPGTDRNSIHRNQRVCRRTCDGAPMAQARGTAHALASATCVYAERNFLRRRRLPDPARRVQLRDMDRSQLFSVAELAALAHLPWDVNAPGLTRAGARATAPAPALPTGGDGGAKVLGDADAGPARAVALPVADARQHVHMLGKTGSGKSTLLVNLILQDAEAGRGQVVIDPMGDLVSNVIDRLPGAALNRPVVLFDPCDETVPVPRVNMLDGAEPYLATDHLVGIFSKIYSGFWGPRTDDLLRAACLTLMQADRARADLPFPTLAEVPELLTDARIRRRYTDALRYDRHRVLLNFWAGYEQHSEAARAQLTAPLLNKLRGFLMRDYPARVIASGPTDIDMQAVLSGGLLLARLPKGVLGEETSRLLGSFLIAKTWQGATARAALSPDTHRPDATLIVDEAHTYLNLPLRVEDMLAEARGYRLSLMLAHQDLGQLPAAMREAISANARSKIYFNTSPEDAAKLAKHTYPNLGEHDLSRLGAYQAAVRLVVGGDEQPACTLATRPMPPAIPGRATELRTRLAGNGGPSETTSSTGTTEQEVPS